MVNIVDRRLYPTSYNMSYFKKDTSYYYKDNTARRYRVAFTKIETVKTKAFYSIFFA
jgi:hypothetical protein